MKTKRTIPQRVIEQEAKALSGKMANLRGTVTRREFAKEYGVLGGESMIYQHIQGIRPISMDAAVGYAKGLKCSIADFSPRLYNEVKALSAAVLAADKPREPTEDEFALVPQKNTGISIPQFDLRFAMGPGQVASDYPEVIRTWEVAPEWLKTFAPEFIGNPRRDLCIATGVGDCLKPWYNNGDSLLMDRSIENQPLRAAGIYAFRFDKLLYVKELRPVGRRGAGAYERNGSKALDIDFSKDDFSLLAKVLKAWRIE
jgi:hypothetical protein